MSSMGTWIARQARPGAGLRVAVKDLIDVAGQPTTAGCRALAERAEPAPADAACLAGLRASIARGTAHLAGKTNLHELAYGISGVNAAFGTPVNPLDPGRVPGGSSSGSAVAVACGEADIAYGSDTGGSIRIPAACCGVAGLKTTWGRISLAGVRPLAPSLDTVGPMARGMAGLVAGMALLEPGFTVAADAPMIIGRLAMDADPAIDLAVDAALAAVGWNIVPVAIDGLDTVMAAALTVLNAEAWATNRALVQAAPELIGPDVLARLRAASTITPAALAAARQERTRWQGALTSMWERVDLLAIPTLLGFPPTLEDAADMPGIRGLNAAINLAGVPALALPVAATGPARSRRTPLPASVQLIGPAGSEEALLAAGALLEQATQV
jgi:amidase